MTAAEYKEYFENCNKVTGRVHHVSHRPPRQEKNDNFSSPSIMTVGRHIATDGGAQQDITTKRIPLSLPVSPEFFVCVCVRTDSFIMTQLHWLTGTDVELTVKPSETSHNAC